MTESNNANDTVQSLLKGMETYLTTKTVVGDPIYVKDTIILPMCDVSFGVGAGAWNGEKKNNGAGAMGGKIKPTAMLVIQNGSARIVSVTNEDNISKLMNLVPDVVNRFFHKDDADTVTDGESESGEKKEA